MKTENMNKEFCFNIIERIENFLPLEYELLIRTNHDSDGLSGSPRTTGNWFVHLIKCNGHKNSGDVKQESIYHKYRNNLYDLLYQVENRIIDIKNEED